MPTISIRIVSGRLDPDLVRPKRAMHIKLFFCLQLEYCSIGSHRTERGSIQIGVYATHVEPLDPVDPVDPVECQEP